MKITHLTGEYPPMQGGIADYLAQLIHYLPNYINQTLLISQRWQAQPAATNLQVKIIPDWGWRSWFYIMHQLKQHQPDILHIQYQAAMYDLGGWVNWLPWYLKQRHWPTKIITTFHDLRIPYLFPKVGRLRWWSILALARYSDIVICTNREDALTLETQLNNLTYRVIPLGNNIPVAPPVNFDRKAWRQQYQADEETLLLAYFGFLNASKGGEELLESMALLRQQGINARLLFIGGETGSADPTNFDYANKIKRLSQQHQLESYIMRTGYVDETGVSANLLAADAVVLPYRDGVSFRRTTLIAALQHGCPVVSTYPASPTLIPEIKPGHHMLLAPPQNGTVLADTIAPLAHDIALREHLSAGAQQLGELFEWSHIAASTVAVYSLVS